MALPPLPPSSALSSITTTTPTASLCIVLLLSLSLSLPIPSHCAPSPPPLRPRLRPLALLHALPALVHALSNKTVAPSPANMTDLQEFSPSIIGGDAASENVVRHICFIIVRWASGDTFQCVGSILSTTQVLTSAHCFYDFPSSQFVVTEVFVVPAQLKRRLGPVYVGRFVDVLNIYDPTTMQHDVAIVTINGFIRDNIQPVKLPRTRERTPRDSIATVAGYGRVRNNARQANVLRSVDLRLESVGKCKLRFTKAVRKTIKRRELLCGVDPDPSGLGGKAFCEGDSGGPLFYRKENGRLLQIGIASFNENVCSSPGATSWFTNLKTYSRQVKQLRDGDLSAWDRRLQYNL